MKHFKLVIFAFGLMVCVSCLNKDPNKQIEEGIISDETYYSEAMGWKIDIPKGWKVMDKKLTDKMQERGLKELDEYIVDDYAIDELKSLISFQKNRFTNLQSTIEPFDEEVDGNWEENNSYLKLILYETFTSRGIKMDTSVTTTEKIDGVEFRKYSFTLLDHKDNIILNQILYGCLRNGHDFGVNINYRDEEDGEVLLKAWRNSKFRN